jgi:uncharacterized membrane protein
MSATPPTPDGEDWTVGYASSNGARANVPSDSAYRLIVLGYITAVAMPLVGLILGIVVATRSSRGNSKHGAWIIVISLIASIVWILVFSSGVLTASSNDLS